MSIYLRAIRFGAIIIYISLFRILFLEVSMSARHSNRNDDGDEVKKLVTYFESDIQRNHPLQD